MLCQQLQETEERIETREDQADSDTRMKRENTSKLWAERVPEIGFPQSEPQHDNYQTSVEIWEEFVENTTLHGTRYVFMKRHVFFRIIWLVLLLTSGGYYVSVVYGAINKYYNRPVNTVLSRKHLKEMNFPAVTICSLNLFAKSKILMRDDDPLFGSSGLNISSCAVTSEVRGNKPCGLSLLCSSMTDDILILNSGLSKFCTSQYRQGLLDAMKLKSHRMDTEEFLQHYSLDITDLIGPLCTFGWEELTCSAKDFVPIVTEWGMCYTFNSGAGGKVRKVDTAGVSSGMSLILDTQTSEYTQGKFSEGFKVLIHGQGEYFDEFEGINVGPGQHAVIALSQKRVRQITFFT